jgi:hypothetical protein
MCLPFLWLKGAISGLKRPNIRLEFAFFAESPGFLPA